MPRIISGFLFHFTKDVRRSLVKERTPKTRGDELMKSGEMDDGNHIPVEVDAKPVVKLTEGLTDIIQGKDEEIRKIKDKHRGVLKEIREALNTINIFSSDSLEDHQGACRTINDILEDNGI